MDKERVCHYCGANRTVKGHPLKGNYCSPRCLEEALHRPDKHNIITTGTKYLSDEDPDPMDR